MPISPALRIAAIAAPVLTLGAVGVGFAVTGGTPAGSARPAAASIGHVVAGRASDTGSPLAEAAREQRINRSSDRLKLMVRAAEVVQRKQLTRFTTDLLNVRTTPAQDADVVGELKSRTKVVATGVRRGDFAEISYRGGYRWVTAAYLALKMPPKPVVPAAPEAMGLSSAPCPDGGVENGLTSSAVAVYRAVCHNFPQITSYGGYDAHGEHASGKAIDIMTSDVGLGTQIADFLRAHASELNLYDVIWRQQIWTPVRSSEGWRSMPSRGSATANHFDHVHVSVN